MFGWKSESWLAGRMGSIVHLSRGLEMLLAKAVILRCFGISPFTDAESVADQMTSLVNSHCAHKSTILISVFREQKLLVESHKVVKIWQWLL